MPVADPSALAIGLGLAVGPAGAALARRGRRVAGVLLGALLGAAAAFAAVHLEPNGDRLLRVAGAAAAGAAAALVLPGLDLSGFRRRSFGSAFGRGGFSGALGSASLPARCAARRPSRLLDAADRLRLESALVETEEKSGTMLAVALVAAADAHEGARWRAAVWAGALALATAAAAGAAPLAGFGAAAAGLLAGRTLARLAHVRRLFASEAELAAASAQAALDAFAHAGLLHAPAANGVLVFAALFEGRVGVLAGRGASGAGSEPVLDEMAREAAAGIAQSRALGGFAAAIARVERLSGIARSDLAAAAPARPYPVRVED